MIGAKRRKEKKMNRIRNCIGKVGSSVRAGAAALAAAAACAGVPLPGLAAGSDPATVVKAVIDVVVKIFPYVGAFFVVSGVFKLILAYRNDQPEAQAGAAKDVVIGAVFIVFAVFVWEPISAVVF